MARNIEPYQIVSVLNEVLDEIDEDKRVDQALSGDIVLLVDRINLLEQEITTLKAEIELLKQ